MKINITWLSWFMASVVAYYFVLFIMARWIPKAKPNFEASRAFVILVPARNEELVLEATLQNLLEIHQGLPVRILIIDDGSSDATPRIAADFARRESRVRLLTRALPEAATGKSDALNAAFALLSQWCAAGDQWLDGHGPQDLIVAIVDADGRLEPDCVGVVAPYFDDESVGSVQLGVRIYNATDNVLARLQDMEFVGFTYLVQIARDKLGSSGLGGNGQFTRLSALQSLGDKPWNSRALTEDLDLGLRIIEAGWRTRFCHHTTVAQQGLTRFRPLLRQRTRWIQGHYQCWIHIPRLLKSRSERLLGRLDLILYLFLVVTVVVITSSLVLSILAAAGWVRVESSFLETMPESHLKQLVSLLLAITPVVIFMWTYQRFAESPLKWYSVPTYAVVFTLYSYLWVITTFRAWFRMAARRGGWVKTPRVASDSTVLTRSSS